MQFEKLGDFQVLAVGAGAKKNVASSPGESLFLDMDFLKVYINQMLTESFTIIDETEIPNHPNFNDFLTG